MTDSENFFARWARMKHEAGVAENDRLERMTTEDLSATPVPVTAAFEPSSLPPIDSIDAGTISGLFSRSVYPKELTRQALRSAWTADPAIRDFVGIAENQWDFNDVAATPGFGLLGPADYAHDLLAQAMGYANDAPDAVPPVSGGVQDSASAIEDGNGGERVDADYELTVPSMQVHADIGQDNRSADATTAVPVTQGSAPEPVPLDAAALPTAALCRVTYGKWGVRGNAARRR